MNSYLLTVLVNEKLEEKEHKDFLENLKKNLGEVKKEDLWGMKGLSYPIKGNHKAFYAHFEFETEAKNINSLDKGLKLNEDIIRYLLIRK